MEEEKRKKVPPDALRLPEGVACNLSDFALFLSVMRDCEAHHSVLSIVLDEPELRLSQIHVEETFLNHAGKRAIRLDSMAVDVKNRHFATEMQNDTSKDDVRRRSRYYQGLLDVPILKSGKGTRYRELPSSVIIFITQEDIFGRDLAKYTFTEQCEEIAGFHLEDGTTKLFLNMASKNGDPVLVSLLQYMKDTRLDNPEVQIKDQRLLTLDRVVQEVKQSEEWEEKRMDILTYGWEQGVQKGLRAFISLCREIGLTDQETEEKLREQFSLSQEEIRECLKRKSS